MSAWLVAIPVLFDPLQITPDTAGLFLAAPRMRAAVAMRVLGAWF